MQASPRVNPAPFPLWLRLQLIETGRSDGRTVPCSDWRVPAPPGSDGEVFVTAIELSDPFRPYVPQPARGLVLDFEISCDGELQGAGFRGLTTLEVLSHQDGWWTGKEWRQRRGKDVKRGPAPGLLDRLKEQNERYERRASGGGGGDDPVDIGVETRELAHRRPRRSLVAVKKAGSTPNGASHPLASHPQVQRVQTGGPFIESYPYWSEHDELTKVALMRDDLAPPRNVVVLSDDPLGMRGKVAAVQAGHPFYVPANTHRHLRVCPPALAPTVAEIARLLGEKEVLPIDEVNRRIERCYELLDEWRAIAVDLELMRSADNVDGVLCDASAKPPRRRQRALKVALRFLPPLKA